MMALIRCESCGKPTGMRQNYPHAHPATTSTSRLFCGAPSCSRIATYAWLTNTEQEQYLRGERRFRVQRYRVLVEVT
jgi:hypothetical protein